MVRATAAVIPDAASTRLERALVRRTLELPGLYHLVPARLLQLQQLQQLQQHAARHAALRPPLGPCGLMLHEARLGGGVSTRDAAA